MARGRSWDEGKAKDAPRAFMGGLYHKLKLVTGHAVGGGIASFVALWILMLGSSSMVGCPASVLAPADNAHPRASRLLDKFRHRRI